MIDNKTTDTGDQHTTAKPDFDTLAEATDALVAEAMSLGLDDDAFDDAVYDAAIDGHLGAMNETDDEDDQESEIETAESAASRINNTGFGGQIEYLLAGHGNLADGVAAVRAIMTETP